MNHDVSDLKPCPFCGAEAVMWSWNYGTAIQCKNHRANGHLVYMEGKTSTEAIEKWNQRAEGRVRNESKISG